MGAVCDSQTQSGASVTNASVGEAGMRSRRQPASSETSTSSFRWSSGALGLAFFRAAGDHGKA
jgi:hypothetical protein